jgi:hypothetical protein
LKSWNINHSGKSILWLIMWLLQRRHVRTKCRRPQKNWKR